MEQRRGANDDTQDVDADVSKENTREHRLFGISQTLEAWLRRRSQSEQEASYADPESDEEDEDDETGVERKAKEKTRKFRRLLQTFFGGEVKKEVISAQERPQSEVESVSGEPEQADLATDSERPFDPVVATVYETQQRQSEPMVTSETTIDPALPENADRPTSTEAVSPAQPVNEVEVLLRPPAAREPQDYEKSLEAKQIKQKREHTKLEKRERRHNKRDKREIKQLKERTVQLEQEQKHTAKRVEKVTATPSKPEAPIMPVAVPEMRAHQPQEKEVTAVERPPESIKEILEKRKVAAQKQEMPQTNPSPETLARSSYEAIRPEAVQQQVEKAAEQDVAIEGMFERRHETKDLDVQQKHRVSTGGAALVGQAAYPPITAVSSPLTSVAPQAGVNPQSQPLSASKPPLLRQEYQQAARNGVMAALVLLLFIALMAFLR